MNPYALPRSTSRRVRHLSIRTHFNQPMSRAELRVSPFRLDVAGIVRAVVIGAPLLLVAVAMVLA